MGHNISHASSHYGSSHPASESDVCQPQSTLSTPHTAATALPQYSVVIPESSTASTASTPGGRRSEARSRGPKRSDRQVTPDMYQRPRSKPAQVSFGPGQPPNVPGPVPPLPPAVRPRAMIEAASSYRARGPRNENRPVDPPPTLEPPRPNQTLAPDESSHGQLTSIVRSTLSDNFRFASTLFSRKPLPFQPSCRFRILVVGKVRTGHQIRFIVLIASFHKRVALESHRSSTPFSKWILRYVFR
jgi:hypothetical protein